MAALRQTRYRTTGINGVSVFVLSSGAVVLISGLTNKSISSVIKNFLAGSAPQAERVTTGLSSFPTDTGEHSGQGGTSAKNKVIGRAMAAAYGWSTGSEWDALDKLWTQESGWRNTAENSSSGALGIAQALPPSKYPAAAQKPTLSASAQIGWGLRYIRSRYGDPVNAWAHEQSYNWY